MIDADLTDWTFVFDQDFDSILTQVDGPLDADGTRPMINGGGDLRFSSDSAGTTQLPIDVRTAVTNNTPTLGEIELAGKRSVSSSVDTDIWLWWGKTGETQPAVGSTYGQYNAYKSEIEAVWTLSEDPSGGSGAMKDRTSNQNHGTSQGSMVTGDSVDSPIGNGVDFESSKSQYINFSDADNLTFGDGSTDSSYTVEALTYARGTTFQVWLAKADAHNNGEYHHGLNASTHTPLTRNSDQSSLAWKGRASTASDNGSTWYHKAHRYDGTTQTIYRDGVSQSTTDSSSGSYTAMENTTRIPVIGRRGTSGWYWEGILSEVRIYSEEVSTSFVKANYNNQTDQTGFLTWGAIEDVSGGDSTNLLDGKIQIKDSATDLLDGEIVIVAATESTDLLDGKIQIASSDTDLLDGKINVQSKATDLLDGKLQIKDTDTDLLDGKVQIKDTDTDLLDGKVQIKDTDTDLLDGKVQIEDTDTNLLDGAIQIKSSDTNLLDGKLIIQSKATDLLDGKIEIAVAGIATNILDGKVQIKDTTTDLLDGRIAIGNSDTNLLDGKISIKNASSDLLDGKIIVFSAGAETNLLDGKVQIEDTTIDLLDGRIDVQSSDTNLLDGKLIVTGGATNLLDGKINIKSSATNLLDGKLSIDQGTVNLLDGKVIITGGTTDLLDGKLIIVAVLAEVITFQSCVTTSQLMDSRLTTTQTIDTIIP